MPPDNPPPSVDLRAKLAALDAAEENYLFDFSFEHSFQFVFEIQGVKQSTDTFRLRVDLRAHLAWWRAVSTDTVTAWQPIAWLTLSGSPGANGSTLRWTDATMGYSLHTVRTVCPEDYDRFRELAAHFDPPF